MGRCRLTAIAASAFTVGSRDEPCGSDTIRPAGAPFRAAGERPASVAEGRAGSPVGLRDEGGDGLGQDRLRADNV